VSVDKIPVTGVNDGWIWLLATYSEGREMTCRKYASVLGTAVPPRTSERLAFWRYMKRIISLAIRRVVVLAVPVYAIIRLSSSGMSALLDSFAVTV
jgi:hypothetical protein